jgi:small subunit ribosomal protein S16
MAVTIRLRRTGARNAASYRVVAADERSPRDGRFIENLGWYDPRADGENFKLDLERIRGWQQKGARLTATVKNLVKRAGAAAPASA